MTDGTAQPLVALTAHARAVPAMDRARFADAVRAVPAPGVVLITCHRVEVYGRAGDPGLEAIADQVPGAALQLAGEAAVRHLVRVAVGRDSAVLGEDEVLHQLRAAFDAAGASVPLDRGLAHATAVALRAGRVARSWQQRRRRSLGDVAVAAIHDGRTGRPGPRRILVVGAGTMGALAARAVVAAGDRVVIANRSPDRAATLAASTGGSTSPLDPGPLAGAVDGVIVAIGDRWRIGGEATTALLDGDAVVVDLSFPPAAGALEARLGRRYVSADALARDPSRDAAPALLGRLDALIDDTVRAIGVWEGRGGSRAVAAALVRRADADRARELERLWRRLPAIDDDARALIEDMTRHLALRLLRPPLERLGSDRDDRATAAVRDLFAL